MSTLSFLWSALFSHGRRTITMPLTSVVSVSTGLCCERSACSSESSTLLTSSFLSLSGTFCCWSAKTNCCWAVSFCSAGYFSVLSVFVDNAPLIINKPSPWTHHERSCPCQADWSVCFCDCLDYVRSVSPARHHWFSQMPELLNECSWIEK